MWYVWIVREKWIRGDGSAATILSYIGAMFYALHPPLPHCPSHTFLLCRCCVSSIPKHAKTHHITNFPSFHVRAHTHATPTCYHPFSLSPCILYLLYIYETTKPHTNTTKSMSTTTRIIWNKLNQLKNGTQINTFIYYELSELPKWK